MFERPRREVDLRQHRWAAPALAGVAGLIFLLASFSLWTGDDEDKQGATTTTVTTALGSTTTAVARTAIAGFSEIRFVVTQQDGSSKDRCALLAETPEQQAKGLMGQANLAGYDGMIFSFASDVTSEFYMPNILFPISIAWFDATGKLVSTTDTEPCTVDAAQCPRYKAAGPYRYAIEVPKGQLGSHGITAGSTMAIGGPCS